MRKLIYHIGTSLDNFISREDGSIEGFLWEGDHVDDYLASLKAYDTVLMGKTTYAWGIKFGGLKPGQTGYPWMKNYIFSKTLGAELEPAEGLEIVDRNEVEFVRQLKETEGADIYLCGGGAFAGFMLDHQLIDVLKIKLYPVILGSGIRLFGNSTQTIGLSLIDSKAYKSGVLLLSYQVDYP